MLWVGMSTSVADVRSASRQVRLHVSALRHASPEKHVRDVPTRYASSLSEVRKAVPARHSLSPSTEAHTGDSVHDWLSRPDG